MPSLEKIREYAETVGDQIRWEKARPRVSEEIENHVTDTRDAYVAQGLDEDAATDMAIADTGDAAVIGLELDRIHRPKPQWGMLAATVVLLLLGILVRLFVFNDEDRVGLLSFRLFHTGIGIVAMFVAYFADFTLVGRFPKTVYFGLIAAAGVVSFLSPNWYGTPFYTQYIVLLFPVAYVAIIFAARNKGYKGIILCGLAYIVPGAVAVSVTFVSVSLLFTVVGVALLCLAICKNWFGVKKGYGLLLVLVPTVLVAVVLFAGMEVLGPNRLTTALHPELAPQGAGYMGVMARRLLDGAVFFGQGNIPSEYIVILREPASFFYTDMLLTALISLMGWSVLIVVFGAIGFFVIKGFKSCFKQKSGLGFLVSMAIMLTFTLQVIGYVVYNLGFQLIPPISLPLISYGNAATATNLLLIGLMLSVFRTGDIAVDGIFTRTKKRVRRLSWADGKLTIDFRLSKNRFFEKWTSR